MRMKMFNRKYTEWKYLQTIPHFDPHSDKISLAREYIRYHKYTNEPESKFIIISTQSDWYEIMPPTKG